MRSTIGVLLAVLISPLAQAELIDEIADRGELRIAVQADNPPYAFKQDERLSGFDVEFGQTWPANWTCVPNLSRRLRTRYCQVWKAASMMSR